MDTRRQHDAMTTPADGAINSDAMGVLIVDDHVDTASMLSTLIKGWGYRTCIANSAREALARCVEFRPRVVLLDLGLPDQHGYVVAKNLRAEMRDRAISFVAITGWSQIADQLNSASAGISHHLVKPVNPDALRAILDGYQAAVDRVALTK